MGTDSILPSRAAVVRTSSPKRPMQPGQIEDELGVPIPGEILPEAEWARTAVKRLPEPGPLDWEAIFGRKAPVVLDLGCGNGRYTLAQRAWPGPITTTSRPTSCRW